MSGWRVARSLDVLLDEINSIAPGRSKASDGAIGDRAHAASASDHNPNNANVVCARDFTHDPGSGADMDRISRRIVAILPPALKYIIWDRRIWSRSRAADGWRPYSGSNPHTRHMHVSVGEGPDGHSTGPYDDSSPWGLRASGGTVQRPQKPAASQPIEEIVMSLPTIRDNTAPRPYKRRAQALLAANGFPPANSFNSKGEPDGAWGPGSTAALKRFQVARKVPGSIKDNGEGDGILGTRTWAALLGS
jgi:hypothetical protein